MFSYIYEWLSGMYSPDLNDYLWGFNCNTQGYTDPECHTFFGLLMVVTSIAVAAIYYFVINSPRFNHKWHWTLFMLLAFATNFVIGFYFTNADLNNGNIPDCLMFMRDADGNITSQLIYQSDCLMFGLENAIYAIVIYFLASVGFKFLSRNCKYVPF